MTWLSSLATGILKSKWFWVTIVVIVLIAGIVISVNSYITSLSLKVNALQNELATRDTLLKVAEGAYTRIAFQNEEIRVENTKLRKRIEEDKEKILTLSSIKQTTKVESVYVPVRGLGRFNYTNPWITFQGSVIMKDSGVVSDIFVERLAIYDSLGVIITTQDMGLIRGYVVTYSPYSIINDVRFEVNMPQTKYNLIGAIRSAFVSDKGDHLRPQTYFYASGVSATIGYMAGGQLKHAIIGAGFGLAVAFVVDYFILGTQH